jgi:hypothetical protein
MTAENGQGSTSRQAVAANLGKAELEEFSRDIIWAMFHQATDSPVSRGDLRTAGP